MKIRDITESTNNPPRIGDIVHVEGGDPASVYEVMGRYGFEPVKRRDHTQWRTKYQLPSQSWSNLRGQLSDQAGAQVRTDVSEDWREPDTRGWREKVLSILKDRDGQGQPRRDVRKVDNHTYTFTSRGGDPHELRFDPELTDRFWVTGSGRDWDSNRFDSMEDAIEALHHLLG